MGRKSSRGADIERLPFPFGQGGLDSFGHPAKIADDRLRTGNNIRGNDGALARRPGAKKLYAAADTTGSWTFAASKYAVVTHAAQLLIPVGGFAVKFSITAVRPTGGNTAYVISTRVSAGKNYGPFTATLSDAGVLTCEWRKESDESAVSIASTALSAGATAHVLFIFDADAGTTTLYINGASDGTPVTGITSTEQPMQDGPEWWFGHNNDGLGAAAANTEFTGKLDAFTLLTLRGTRPADGDPTLVETLQKWSFQQWSNPQSAMCLLNIDFDEGSGTVLYDTSRFKNDGTITGAPSATAAVAHRAMNGNHVGLFEETSGKRTNLVGIGGNLFYEVVRAATS